MRKILLVQDAYKGIEVRHSLNLKTLTLSVPDEEELQTEFEVEDQGRTFRCILYFVKSGVSTGCPKK